MEVVDLETFPCQSYLPVRVDNSCKSLLLLLYCFNAYIKTFV